MKRCCQCFELATPAVETPRGFLCYECASAHKMEIVTKLARNHLKNKIKYPPDSKILKKPKRRARQTLRTWLVNQTELFSKPVSVTEITHHTLCNGQRTFKRMPKRAYINATLKLMTEDSTLERSWVPRDSSYLYNYPCCPIEKALSQVIDNHSKAA